MPPFAGVAVNITKVPAQTGFAVGEMETLTGRLGLTIIVIELEVAGLFAVQAVIEEVRIQVTLSPLFGVYE